MRVRIENVTSSVKLDRTLDLDSLIETVAGMEPGNGNRMAVLRLTDSVTVQFYENGNVVCTGSRSTDGSRKALAEALWRADIDAGGAQAEIRDIMATTVLDHDVNLERACEAFGLAAEYNPEWFTGVIVHRDGVDTTGIVYANGKIVVSGAADMDSVYDTFDYIIGVLGSTGPQ